jgi:hypothetical protein
LTTLQIFGFDRVFGVEGIPHICWQINCPSIIEFVRMLVVEGITYIYW